MPSSDDLVTLFAWALGALTIPTIAYVAKRRTSRYVWPARTVTEPLLLDLADPYRLPGKPILVTRVVAREGTPPLVVRAAAFASYFLGQMFVPGLLVALVGLFVYGIGLLGIPGLYVAWRTFGLGSALLGRDWNAIERAERMATVSVVLNVAVMAVGLGFLAVSPEFGIFLIAYASISIAHAALLKAAATSLRTLELGVRADEVALAPATA